MAESGVAAFSAVTGVVIVLTTVCFILRSKGHSDGLHNHDYDKVTTEEVHIYND